MQSSLTARALVFGFAVILLLSGVARTHGQAVPGWLAQLNAYRASAGLGPLAHEPAWSAEAALHAKYMVREGVLAHSEDVNSPWYTSAGHTAARNSNVMDSRGSVTTDTDAIDLWMEQPFHAVAMIDPRLVRTGFGSYRDSTGPQRTAAALDVHRGRSGSLTGVRWPILWPGPGRRVPIGRYGGGEYPNPLASCRGYSVPSGLPLISQFGPGSVSPVVSASSFSRAGQALAHCVFTETTYVSADHGEQALARSILAGRDAVVLVPRAPLLSGSTYTASLTVDGTTHAWSFTVAPF